MLANEFIHIFANKPTFEIHKIIMNGNFFKAKQNFHNADKQGA